MGVGVVKLPLLLDAGFLRKLSWNSFPSLPWRFPFFSPPNNCTDEELSRQEAYQQSAKVCDLQLNINLVEPFAPNYCARELYFTPGLGIFASGCLRSVWFCRKELALILAIVSSNFQVVRSRVTSPFLP